MTARENIAIGRIESMSSEPEIELAAHKSLADTVVAKLAGATIRCWAAGSKAA